MELSQEFEILSAAVEPEHAVDSIECEADESENWDANDCPVCLGEHDAEIHEATLGVKRWFRAQVTKSFVAAEQPELPFAATIGVWDLQAGVDVYGEAFAMNLGVEALPILVPASL